MRISHTKLEIARSDPKSFKSKIKADGGFQGRLPQYRVWQYATRKFHAQGKDAAYQNMEETFKNNYKDSSRNQKKLEEYQYKLDNYIQDYERLGNSALGWGTRLQMDLNHSNVLVGEMAREDMKMDGSFEVFVFIKEDTIWESELRFPIMQAHYAQNIYGVPFSQVAVGVYCFEQDQHISQVFTNKEVQDALNELKGISRIIGGS